MLRHLKINNLATIKSLDVDFKDGLNVLTGETGAGKSVIVEALDLLVGGRKNTGVIRTGERVAVIGGVFELEGSAAIKLSGILTKVGIEQADWEELHLRREFQAGGRSRSFLNDQLVALNTIREIRPQILEIHGQGGQHELAGVKTHLELLDSFAGSTALRSQVNRAFTRLREAENKLQILESHVVKKKSQMDLLRFQVSEIKRIAPRPNEDTELWDKKMVLAHAEQAVTLGNAVYQDLYEGEGSVIERLGLARRRLQQLAMLDTRLAALPDSIESSVLSLTDVVETLRGYEEKLEFSDERLKDVESRLEELETLKRKYGCELNELGEVLEGLEADLQRWEGIESEEVELRKQIEEARAQYIPLAISLTDQRRAAVPALERRMVEALAQMALEQARFIVQIESASGGVSDRIGGSGIRSVGEPQSEDSTSLCSFFSTHGADRVEFLFSANPGESEQPLGRVASGGELSRLMLTLISTIIESEGDEEDTAPETVVFDEIDVGIGGRVAEAVGQKLRSLASKRQVFCVTHQPQIARFADHHFALVKSVEKGRTATKIRELNFEEKVGELARMVGGDRDAEVARKTARWMLGDNLRKGGSAEARKKTLKRA